jgi:hypothetical protein
MTQTAVEWLEKEFVKLEVTIGVHGVMYEIIEQAKEMEKKQIMNSWVRGVISENNVTAEQYYNKTFKKD